MTGLNILYLPSVDNDEEYVASAGDLLTDGIPYADPVGALIGATLNLWWEDAKSND